MRSYRGARRWRGYRGSPVAALRRRVRRRLRRR